MTSLRNVSDPFGDDLVGIQIGNILPFENDPSFGGLQDPREGEQKGGLPAPLGPKSETISPCSISKEISFNAGKGPYWTVSFLILSIRIPTH